jgi:hypothetical protein
MKGWQHILDRHGTELGDHAVFDQDMKDALTRPKLVYLDRKGSYSESEMFVECSKDSEYHNYVVLVAVKARNTSRPFVASGRLRPEVPPPGRRAFNVLHGTPAMYPCGSPRAEMRQRIGERWGTVLDELRTSLENNG